jgi:ribose transport system substrate-binding protein
MLVALTVPIAACSDGPAQGSGAGSSSVDIAVVTTQYAGAAKVAIDLLGDEAESNGWNLSTSDAANDYNKFNSFVQDAVNRGVDAIVIAFPDPSQISVGLAAATAAGIPVLALDSGVDPVQGALWNGTSNNEDLGSETAEILTDNLASDAGVIMLTFTPHNGVRLRTEAAKAYFEEHGVTVIDVKDIAVPTAATEEARSIITDYLIANPGEDSLGGVWTGFDIAGLGAVQALEADGRDVPVTSVDGEAYAVEAIENGDGPWLATAAQDWAAIVDGLVANIDTVISGGELTDDITYYPGKLVVRP